MLCSELMKRDVERCLDTSLVTEAAIAMRDRNVGFLPVCRSEDGVVIGTITDRDIVIRVLAGDEAPERTLVTDVMTRPVASCRPDDELAVAEDLMIRFQKARIVCVDQHRRAVGIISLSDVARVETQGHAGTIAASIALREATGAVIDRKALRTMACRDVMKTVVHFCRRYDPVRSVAARMRDRNVGFVPVCDDAGTVIGTITDRDLVLRVVAERRAPETTIAGDVLTPELVFCSPEDPLRVAEELMGEHKKSRIVIADEARRPLGVISLSDIARLERSRTVSRVLREVSSRAPSP